MHNNKKGNNIQHQATHPEEKNLMNISKYNKNKQKTIIKKSKITRQHEILTGLNEYFKKRLLKLESREQTPPRALDMHRSIAIH